VVEKALIEGKEESSTAQAFNLPTASSPSLTVEDQTG
jgi:hypothetical protein